MATIESVDERRMGRLSGRWRLKALADAGLWTRPVAAAAD
jgi:hypothetical protein